MKPLESAKLVKIVLPDGPSRLNQMVKIGEACRILGISIDTLRRWERTGKIQAIYSPGGTRFYSIDDLTKISQGTYTPPSTPRPAKKSTTFSSHERGQSKPQPETLLNSETQLLKIGEAAKMLGISIDSLRRWEREGKLTASRTPGGTRVYSARSLNTLKKDLLNGVAPSVTEFSKVSATKVDGAVERTEEVMTENLPGAKQTFSEGYGRPNGTFVHHQESSSTSQYGGIDHPTILTPPQTPPSLYQTSLVLEEDFARPLDWGGFENTPAKQVSLSLTYLPHTLVTLGLIAVLTTGILAVGNVVSPQRTQKIAAYLPGLNSLAEAITEIAFSQAQIEELHKEDPKNNFILSQNVSSDLLGSDIMAGQVLAANDVAHFLEINSSTTIGGDLTTDGSALVGLDLDVTGETTIGGGLTVSGATVLEDTLEVSSQTTLTDLIASGQVQITGNTEDTIIIQPSSDPAATVKLFTLKNAAGTERFSINAGGDVNFTGSGTVGGTLKVTGASTLAAVTATTLTTSDLATLASLKVTGASTLSGAATLESTLKVTGTTTLSSSLEVSGASTLGSTLAVTGATTMASTLAVTGAATFSSTINTNALTATALTFSGDSPRISSGNGQIALIGGVGIGYTDSTPPTFPSLGLAIFGNVGIGTTSPSAKLDVIGNANITGSLTIGSGSILQLADGSASSPALTFTNDTNVGLWRIASDLIALTTSGSATSGIAIDSNGNLGVGTTSPNSKFSVIGNASIGADYNAYSPPNNGLLVQGNTGIGTSAPQGVLDVNGVSFFRGALSLTTGQLLINDGSSSLPAYSFLNSPTAGLYSPSLNALSLITSGSATSGITINSGGYVGVGTTSPGAKLAVSGGTVIGSDYSSLTSPSNGLFVQGNMGIGTTATSMATFSLGGNGIIGSSWVSTQTAPTNGLLVQGNVGIGSTFTNTYTLSVGGNIGVSGHVIPTGGSYDIGSSGQRWNVGYFNEVNATTLAGTVTGGSTSAADWTINSDNASADTETMSLTFERGSLSPNAVLRWDTGDKQFNLNSGLLIGSTPVDSQITDNVSGLEFSSIPFDITTSGSEHLALVPGGNVGIGTTAPGAKLDLAGDMVFSGADRTLTFDFESATGTIRGARGLTFVSDYDADTSGTSDSIIFKTNNAEVVRINENGNIGIGTSVPVQLAHIYGAAATSLRLERISQQGWDFGVGNSGFASTGSLILRPVTSDNYFAIQNQAAGAARFTVNTSTGTVYTAGNIGIGVSLPGSRLNVVGNAVIGFDTTTSTTIAGPTNGLGVLGNVGVGTTTANYNLSVIGTGNFTGQLTLADGSASAPGLAFSSDTDSGLWRNTTNMLSLTTNGSGSLQTNSNINGLSVNSTGFVGIGTTSPSGKLQVAGTSGNWYVGADGNTNYFTRASANYFIANSSGGYFNFIVNGGTTSDAGATLRVTSTGVFVPNGNVGIGTTNTAGSKLQVAGNTVIGFGTSAIAAPSNGLAIQGNVGIGTTTADHNLSVVGTTNITGTLTLGGSFTPTGQILASDGTAALPGYAFSSDTNSGLWRSASDVIHLTTGGTNTNGLAINASGNVGIGTSTPATLFDLSANDSTTLRLTSSDTTFTSTDYGRIEFFSADSSRGPRVNAMMKAIDDGGSGAVASLTFHTWDTTVNTGDPPERLRISSSGNVGIGFTSPSASLHVLNTASQDSFRVDDVANDTSPFIVDLNGNVGVGTSAPSYPLDVNGNIRFFGGSNINDGIFSYSSTGNQIFSLTRQNVPGTGSLAISSFNGIGFAVNTTSPSTSYAMTITSGGNVGIGFTSPSAITHILNTGAGNSFRVDDIANDSSPFIIDNVGNVGVSTTTLGRSFNVNGSAGAGGNWASFQYAGTETFSIRDTASYIEFGTPDVSTDRDFIFKTVSGEKLTILSGGNVGIGTTGPSSILELASATPQLTFNSSNSVDGYVKIAGGSFENLYIGVPTGAFIVENASGGADYLSIDSSTMVVTPTSWTATPTISGVITASSQVRLSDGTASAPGLAFSSDTNSGLWRSAADFVHLTTAGDSDNGITIDASGNVGVGTSVPAVKLDILGGNAAQLRLRNTASNATLKNGYLQVGHYTNSEEDVLGMLMQSNSTTSTIYFGGGSSALNTATSLQFYTASDNTTLTGNERLRINSAGNVGIGNSNPGSGLSLSGNATIGFGGASSIAGPSNGLAVSGIVGIGTTSPGATLHVTTSSGLATFNIGKLGNFYGRSSFADDISDFCLHSGATSDCGTFTARDTEAAIQRFSDGNVWFYQDTSLTAGSTYTPTLRMFLQATSGNVGIGPDTSPDYLLDVQGTFNADGAATFGSTITSTDQILASDGTAALPGLAFSSDTNSGLWRSASDVIHLTTGGALYGGISINASGNVGIGTTGASSKLVVFDTGTSSGNVPSYFMNLRGQNNNATDRFRFGETGNQDAAIGITNADLVVFTGASALTESARFLTGGNIGLGLAGNVGIGTTAPNSLLSLQNNASAGTTLLGVGTDTQGVTLTVKSAGTTAATYNSNTSAVLNIGAATSGDLSNSIYARGGAILAATLGNVGIGTSTPSYKLHTIEDGTTSANNVTTGSGLVISRTTGAAENLAFRTKSGAGISGTTFPGQIIGNGLNIMEIYTQGAAPLVLGTNSTEYLRVSATGNVGIGFSSPAAKLHVSGGNILVDNNSYYSAKTSAGTTVNLLTLTNDASNITRFMAGVDAGGFQWTNQAQSTAWASLTSTTFTSNIIASAQSSNLGRVDFGTDGYNSIYRFDGITKGTGGNRLRIDAYDGIIFGTSQSAGQQTARMAITSAGNVGIGTTIPEAKLHVSGAVLLPNNTALQFELADGSNETALYMTTANTLNLYNNKVNILSGGNVGIGFTSPKEKLQVYDNTGGGNAIENRTQTASAINTLTLYTDTSAQILAFGNNSSFSIGSSSVSQSLSAGGFSRMMTFDTNGNVGINNNLTPAAPIHLLGDSTTTGVQLLTQNSAKTNFGLSVLDNGNVGIGTTLPSYKLQVAGTTANLGYFSTTNGTGSLVLENSTKTWTVTASNASGNPFSINSNDTSNILVAQSLGNVGIGTASPNTKLDVRDGTFSLSDADVAHGVTSIIATTNYAYMTTQSSTGGGLALVGLSDTDASLQALTMYGIIGTESSSVPAVVISGSQKSGTGQAALSSTSQLLSVRNNNSTDLFTILGGGNVGIGTTNPISLLDLTSNSSSKLGFKVNDLHGAQLSASITSTYSSVAWSANMLQFGVNQGNAAPETVMTIRGTGNVGIGITNPAAKLDVASTIRMSRNENVAYYTDLIQNYNDVTTFQLKVLGSTAIQIGITDNLLINSVGTNKNIVLTPNGTGNTVLNGNVGIGWTSPTALLHLRSTGVVTGIIESSSTSGTRDAELRLRTGIAGGNDLSGSIYFTAAGTDQSFIRTRMNAGGSGGLLWMGTNHGSGVLGNDLAITSTGAVGIGTTGPTTGAELDVAGDIVQTVSGTVYNSISASGSFNTVFNEAGADIDFRIESDTNANMLVIDAALNVMALGGGVNSRYFTALGGAGDLAFTSTATSTNDSAAFLVRPASIANTSGTGDISNTHIFGVPLNPAGVSSIGSTLRVGAPSEAGAGSFGHMASIYIEGAPTGGTTNAALTVASGNVGIGTTNPSASLHIGSTSISNSTGLMRFSSCNSTCGGNRTWEIGTTNDLSGANQFSFRIQDTGATSPGLWMPYASNNVGIGTSTPYLKTHISSQVSNIGPMSTSTVAQLKISNPINVTGNYSLINFSFPDNDINALIGARLTSSGSGGADLVFAARSSGSILGEAMTLTGAGNLGIGTTGPAAALHINNTSAYALFSNAGTNRFQIKVDATSGTQFQIVDSSQIYIQNNSGTNLHVFQNGGNVGIGFTTPSSKLTIHQGADDDEILSLRSSDVDHGIARANAPDTFAFFQKVNATTGGLYIEGIQELGTALPALEFHMGATGDTTKSTSGRGMFEIDSYLSTPSGGGQTTAGANIFAIRENSSTRLIVNDDGEIITTGRLFPGTGVTTSMQTTSYVAGDTDGIGIGLIDPGVALHVYGANVGQVLQRAASGQSAGLELRNESNSRTFAIGMSGAAGHWIDDSAANDLNITANGAPLRFGVNSSAGTEPTTTAMIISTTGNVGIGWTSPAGIVHTKTTTSASEFRIDKDTNIISTGFAQLRLSGFTDSNKMLRIGYDTTSTSGFGYLSSLHSGVGFTPLALQPAGGNVGIGHTNPNATFSVVTASTVQNISAAANTAYHFGNESMTTGQSLGYFITDDAAASDEYLWAGYNDFDGTPNLVSKCRTDGTCAADGTWATGGADYAEYVLPKTGTTPAQYPKGSIICILTSDPDTYGLCDFANNQKLAGVISTNPGVIGNSPALEDHLEGLIETPREQTHIALGMLGRVPTRVNTENGPISIGDPLTSSSTPGVAMKATKPGITIGRALDNYSGSGEGNILIYLNVSFADPQNVLASLTIDDEGYLLVPKIRADHLVLNQGLQAPSLDSVSFASSPGTPVGEESEEGEPTTSYSLADMLNRIGELEASSSAQLADLELRIQNQESSSSAVLSSLDTNSQLLATNSAQIAALQGEVEEIRMRLTSPEILDATGSATIANLDVTNTLSALNLGATEATISGTLKSLGDTFLGDTTVAGTLVVDGLFSISNGNEINAIGTLFIQNSPLAQSLDLFNGKVVIDQSGTITSVTLVADQIKVNADKGIGEATLLAGETEMVIANPLVENTSVIILTPDRPLSQTLGVTERLDGRFTVKILTPELEDVNFSYLVIGVAQALGSDPPAGP